MAREVSRRVVKVPGGRYLGFLTFVMLTLVLGCGNNDGDETGNSAGGGGSSGGGGASSGGGTSSGGMSSGGTSSGGTATGGTSNGGTASGGTAGGGGATSARSCERDCAALADTLCAGADFSIETCVPECEQTFQAAAEDARSQGCLEPFLALDVCRADDPVCTHPNPNECVEENDAFIQCLAAAI